MTKRLPHIILFLFCLISIPASAQLGEQRKNFAIGINAGMSFNKVTFNPRIKESNLTGINGGITARYISEKYFAMICGIQAELNFAQRGWKEVIEDGTGNTYHRTMNYVELPLLAHLAFGRERGLRFFLNLGPQIAFFISDSETMGGGEWDTQYRYSAQYGKNVDNKFDYGITGGGGLELRTKAGNFLAEGRYYFGLSDIFGNTKKDPFGRSAHTVISAKLTYLFDIRK